jgi:hypothetical protein
MQKTVALIYDGQITIFYNDGSNPSLPTIFFRIDLNELRYNKVCSIIFATTLSVQSIAHSSLVISALYSTLLLSLLFGTLLLSNYEMATF